MRAVWIMIVALSSQAAGAIVPLTDHSFLVAGCNAPGNKDGGFLEAEFDQPAGLALAADESQLYVADSQNGVIRAVDLLHDFKVSTVVRGLTQPLSVVALAGKALLVLGQDGKLVTVERGAGAKALAGTDYVSICSDQHGGAWASGGSKAQCWHLDSTGLRGKAYELPRALSRTSISVADGVLYALGVGSHTIYSVSVTAQGDFARRAEWKSFSTDDPTGDYDGLVPRTHPLNPDDRLLTWDRFRRTFVEMAPSTAKWETQFLLSNRGGRLGLELDRQLLPDCGGIAYSKRWRYFFASDRASNRILGFEDRFYSRYIQSGGATGISYAQPSLEKPKTTTRVLFIGDSITWFGMPSFKACFYQLFQSELNLDLALDGKRERIEALLHNSILSDMAGGTLSLFSSAPTHYDEIAADEVVVVTDPTACLNEVFAFAKGPVPDDIPGAVLDPADVLDVADRTLGRHSTALQAWCKAHPAETDGLIQFDENGFARFDLYCKPDVLRKVMAVPEVAAAMAGIVRKNVAAAKKQALKHHQRLSILWLPTRNLLGAGELTKEDPFWYEPRTSRALFADMIQDAAQAEGVELIDLTQPLLLAEPMNFPLTIAADHHYTEDSHRLIGHLLARYWHQRKTVTEQTKP